MRKILINGDLILSTPPQCDVTAYYEGGCEDAIVLNGNVKCESITADKVLVTGEVIIDGGDHGEQ